MIVKYGNEILKEQFAGELSADEKWIKLSDFDERIKVFFRLLDDCPLLSDDDISAVKTYFKQCFGVEK